MEYLLHQPLVISHSSEWGSIVGVFFTPEKAFIGLLGMFVAANCVFRPIAYSLRDAIFLGGAIVEACLHVRFLAVFAIAFSPVIAVILARVIPPYEPAKDRPVLNALFIGSILAVCALTFPSREKLVGLMASKYPVQTAAYLRSHPSLRPIFNRTEWGGFLMHSGLRVFINTQSDIFEYTGVLADYFAMIEPTSDEEALLRRYAIRACLLEKETPLAEFLERRPDWRLVASDRVSVLFEYEGSPAAANGSGAAIGRGLSSVRVR